MQLFNLIIMALWTQSILTIKSPVFANTHYIPLRYTCLGVNVNPALIIEGFPKNTKSLALIMEDTDTSLGTFDHWVVWNIPPVERIEENSSPGVTGQNSGKENKYTGPCPPNGIHEYHFRVFALNTELDLPKTTGKEGLIKAMQGHILSSAELIGLFTKAVNHLNK